MKKYTFFCLSLILWGNFLCGAQNDPCNNNGGCDEGDPRFFYYCAYNGGEPTGLCKRRHLPSACTNTTEEIDCGNPGLICTYPICEDEQCKYPSKKDCCQNANDCDLPYPDKFGWICDTSIKPLPETILSEYEGICVHTHKIFPCDEHTDCTFLANDCLNWECIDETCQIESYKPLCCKSRNNCMFDPNTCLDSEDDDYYNGSYCDLSLDPIPNEGKCSPKLKPGCRDICRKVRNVTKDLERVKNNYSKCLVDITFDPPNNEEDCNLEKYHIERETLNKGWSLRKAINSNGNSTYYFHEKMACGIDSVAYRIYSVDNEGNKDDVHYINLSQPD